MEESTSREKVLKAVRDALVNPMDPPYSNEERTDDIYVSPESEYNEIAFAEALARVNGDFVYCSDEDEFAAHLRSFLESRKIDSLHCYEPDLQNILNDNGIFCINSREDFKECEAGITTCEFLIARLGSIMVSSMQPCGRKGFIFPSVHIVVAWRNQLVFDLKDAFSAMKRKYAEKSMPSMVSVVTGPSRTADIEKTLVMGAHGPEELLVFFIDQDESVQEADE
ncbi:MAG: lactate utilization protein [Bacteroidales bacterium]|nr:lactate utilization protein [Bacteroidales bacterium]